MAESLISRHFVTVLLVLLCGIKLSTQKKTKDAELHFFWVTLLCCFLLVIQDILEGYTATKPELLFWRVLLSVIGYNLRPVAAVGLLLVVCPPERRSWKLWIMAIINLAVNLTAFFSPIAFSFNQEYNFVRGPLGYVVFIVSFLYMIQILVLIWRRYYERKDEERWILILSVVGCMAASAIDALIGGSHLNEAMMIGCVFLLFYLRTHDNYLDQLTSLRNRFAFYDDSNDLAGDVSVIASIDMNGLKELNDAQGHTAGDQALAEIGRCLCGISDRNTIPYRVGGDEFVVLFVDASMEKAEKALEQTRADILRAGYSVSIGCAKKEKDQGLEEALHESDLRMYKEKAEYYQISGRDRRAKSSIL